jgi:hypothetical protein|tara:strand:- start:383 stop:712 length:330 start_codon:yes stop_codon:yes gene_type:complete
MAYDYKSVNADLGTTIDTSIYECPSAKTAVVLLCQIANIDGSNSVNVYVDYYDSSNTQAKALAHELPVPADTSLNPIGGKLVLEAGDQLRAWASAASDAEIVVSVVEIS